MLPATKVTLHGIEFNTLNQTSLRQKLINLAKRKKIILIGSLNFACHAISPGRAFLRCLIGMIRGTRRPNHHIRLTVEARGDIAAWIEFLQNFNGQLSFLATNWTSPDVLSLTTEASCFAFGAAMDDSWFQGQFPPSRDCKHISIKELLSIVLAVRRWGLVLTNQRVLFFSDNIAVVVVIKRQTARDPQLMCLVRQLVVACLSDMFPCQAHPWKDRCCCRFYLKVAGRTHTSRSFLP